jgi:hypothetical protein
MRLVGAGELLALRERDRVHDAVELTERLADGFDQPVDVALARDVAGQDRLHAEVGGEVAHVLLEALVGVGECELHALALQRLGASPRDRALVRHAEDQPLPSFEESAQSIVSCGLPWTPARRALRAVRDPKVRAGAKHALCRGRSREDG